MNVQDVMTRDVEYIPSDTTLAEAASKMRDSDTGFLPIGDSDQSKLQGVITDRDIVVRAIAAGKDPNKATVKEFKTDKVLYCYQSDSVESAAENMREQQVYRLVVLDNKDDKRLCGIVSLGDVVRHDNENLGGKTARGISEGKTH
ncbi:MAG: CBS domain-containing protein [Pseudohongiella sp.]|nr:CBS domain-containing protein [Pseudohongiella sp.]MDP2127754.1 CBS domain-containing protein [Pseudohongiella sp.]